MTLLLYVRRKGWDVRSLTVEGSRRLASVGETQGAAPAAGRPTEVFEQTIRVEGSLTPEQLERLKYIAGRCPMHRTLESTPVISERIVLVE